MNVEYSENNIEITYCIYYKYSENSEIMYKIKDYN